MYLCSFHENYMKMKIKRFPNLVSKFNILQILSLLKLLGNATKLGMGGHFSHHLCCKLSNVMSSFTIKFHSLPNHMLNAQDTLRQVVCLKYLNDSIF
jgi:hypothetical protein